MKDFLNRILPDSYNFNKLDTGLNLKLADVREKLKDNAEPPGLSDCYQELTSLKDQLLSSDLPKVYKTCKILSFLLSYSSALSNSASNTRPWRDLDGFFEELTNTLLQSTLNNMENNLINSHLFGLLHQLASYLTGQHPDGPLEPGLPLSVERSKKVLLSNLYNNVVKMNNSTLNPTVLLLLCYFHRTNQLQLNSLDSDNPYLFQLKRLSESPNTNFKDLYNLMYHINKNMIVNLVNNPSLSNLKFLMEVLTQLALKRSGYENNEVNLFNFYQLITDLINSDNFNHNQELQSILFELLKKMVNLLNSDLVLVHLSKLSEIFNFLFRSQLVLLNHSESLYTLVKSLNSLCFGFNQLVDPTQLTNLLNISTLCSNCNSNSSSTDPTEVQRNNSLLKLYVYCANKSDLDKLVSKVVDSNSCNTDTLSILFNQYVSNVISSTSKQDFNYPLLLKVYNLSKGHRNLDEAHFHQVQQLLSQQNLCNFLNT